MVHYQPRILDVPRRNTSFADSIAGGIEGLGESVPGFLDMIQAEREEQALSQMAGQDVSSFMPETRKMFAHELFRQKTSKQDEKRATLQGLKTTIDQMRELAHEGSGLGPLAQFSPTPQGFENRGRMKVLGGEMLNYYKTLFPRGITQEEFKRLERDYIPSTGDTQSGMLGKLEAFEDLINRKLESMGAEAKEEEEAPQKPGEKKSDQFVHMRDPEGKLRKVPAKDVKAAKKAKYVVVK